MDYPIKSGNDGARIGFPDQACANLLRQSFRRHMKLWRNKMVIIEDMTRQSSQVMKKGQDRAVRLRYFKKSSFHGLTVESSSFIVNPY